MPPIKLILHAHASASVKSQVIRDACFAKSVIAGTVLQTMRIYVMFVKVGINSLRNISVSKFVHQGHSHQLVGVQPPRY